MTNEELVMQIKSGDITPTEQLWFQIEKFVRMMANRFFSKYTLKCEQFGITTDDLYQEGYFAFLKAIDYFDPGKECKFLTVFDLFLKSAFYDTCKMRSTRGKNDTTYQAISLDASQTEDGCTLKDIIADERNAIDEYIDQDFQKQFRADAEKAFESCTDRQAQITKLRYYENIRPTEIAKRLNASKASLTRPFKSALEHLRKSEFLAQYQDFSIISAS